MLNSTRNALRATFVLLAFCTTVAAVAQEDPLPADAVASSAAPVVVEVTAVDYAIRAPDELPSGWTTIRFTNEGEEPHFVYLMRLPEGKTMDDYDREVYPPFNAVWHALRSGAVDQERAIGMLVESVPEWFFATEPMGGPGFAAPGITSEVTLNLRPGNYVLECYMKTAEGEFHAMEGMVRPLVVTEERSPAAAPEPTLRLTLTNSGMELAGKATPGRHVVAVNFAENPEMGFPHDVNVARLDDDTKVEDVVAWMNWMNVEGLQPPAPAHFVGGARPMTAGSTAYFTLDLEPGRYLFVSEATGHQGVLKEVQVRHQ